MCDRNSKAELETGVPQIEVTPEMVGDRSPDDLSEYDRALIAEWTRLGLMGPFKLSHDSLDNARELVKKANEFFAANGSGLIEREHVSRFDR
jgi:hypothetical protein